jgi:hypothetical protein
MQHDMRQHSKWVEKLGEYSTHELGITPDAYDAHLDVDFSVLGDDEAAAA